MITALVNTSLQVDDGAMNGSMGAFIERRMELLGLNQSQLARRAGVNRAHLSQVISGKIALPSPDFRRKLAAALGVTHLELLVAAGELTREEASLQDTPEPLFADSELLEMLADLPPERLPLVRELVGMAIQSAKPRVSQSADNDT